jgi:gliding motility-associated-like protein
MLAALLCIAGSGYAQSWNWAAAALSAGSESAHAIAVAPADGRVLSCGVFNQVISNLPGNPSPNVIGVDNGLILAQDSSGNLLTFTTILSNSPVAVNGIGVDNQGDVYVTGSFRGSADFKGNGSTPLTITSNRPRSLFVAKFDAALNGVWVKADTNAQFSEGRALEMYYNQVFVSGSYFGGFAIDSLILPLSNDTDALVMRLDGVNGGIPWGQRISGTGIEVGSAIAVDFNNVIVGGYFTSDSLQLPGTSVLLQNNNGGTADIFVTALRADNGTFLWGQQGGGSSEDVCNGLTVDFQQVYATGTFNGVASFGALGLSSRGNSDAYLWAMDRGTGLSSWVAQEGDTGNDLGKDIDVDEIGGILWAGEFEGAATFGGGIPLTATGANAVFVTNYLTSGTPSGWATMAGNTDYTFASGIQAGHHGTFLAGTYSNVSLAFQGAPSVSLPSGAFANYFTAAINCGPILGMTPTIMAGNDSICVGADFTVTLFNSQGGVTYALYDATADTLAAPAQVGTGGILFFTTAPIGVSMDYRLIVIDASGRCQEELGYYFIQVSPYPQFTIGADTTICAGDSLVLTPTGGPYNAYSWSTGSIAPSIAVNTPGTYWVDLKNSFSCTSTDTIVVQVATVPTPAMADTFTCVGVPLMLFNPYPAYACLWPDNTTDDSLAVVAGGTYWLEIALGNCTARDSFQLDLLAPPYVNLGPDTALCTGGSITLDPTQDPGTYLWSDGSTDTTLVTLAAGSYSVSVTGPNGCVGVDQLNLAIDQVPTLYVGITQTVLCEFDAPIALQPSPAGGALSGDVSLGNFVDPSQLGPGNYLVRYTYTTPGGCIDSVQHAFLVAPAPSLALAGPDQNLTAGNQVQLAGNAPSVGLGTWSTVASGTFDNANRPDAIVSGLPAGTFPFVWTIATPFCGSTSDTVLITVPPFVALMIPTGFSPNDDGANDTWFVAGLENYPERQLKVFNRWGAAVYQDDAWGNDWDGNTSGGAPLSDDTYYYVLDLGGDNQFAGYLIIKR